MVAETEHHKVLTATEKGSFREFEMALEAVKQEDMDSDIDIEYTSNEDTDADMEDDDEDGMLASLPGINLEDITKYVRSTFDYMAEHVGDIEVKAENSGDTVTSGCCDKQQGEKSTNDSDSKNNLKDQDVKRKNQIEIYKCVLCPQSYREQSQLVHHMSTHSDMQSFHDVKPRQENKPAEKYQYGLCKKTFNDEYHLVGHMATHSDQHFFSWNQIVHSTLVSHTLTPSDMQTDHDVEQRKRNEPKAIHQCRECKRTFIFKHDLVKHMATHSHLYCFSCDQCGKAFKQESSLNNHIYLNHRPGGFHCSVCNKKFKNKTSFGYHMDFHKDTRYFCNKCENSYPTRSRLDYHKKRHHNDCNQIAKVYPYKCTECPRGFHRKLMFDEHKAWHRGDYTCEYCGKRYTRKENLRDHVLKHLRSCTADTKVYRCDGCQAEFRLNVSLRHHMREHHPEASDAVEAKPGTSHEKKCQCNWCNKTFKNKRAHTAHVNFVHLQKHFCKICNINFYTAFKLKEHNEVNHKQIEVK